MAVEAIKAIRKEASAAVDAIKMTASATAFDVRSAQLDLIDRIEPDLNKIVKKFAKEIDEILGAYKVRSLDMDVNELREDVVTDEFPDLDSRAVFANPYAIKDPDFSAHFDLRDSTED